MPRIKIQDLNVDLAEIMKKDPQILNKIRGGALPSTSSIAKAALAGAAAGRTTSSTGTSSGTTACPGADTVYCCTGYYTGCEPGPDTAFCSTKGMDCYFTK